MAASNEELMELGRTIYDLLKRNGPKYPRRMEFELFDRGHRLEVMQIAEPPDRIFVKGVNFKDGF